MSIVLLRFISVIQNNNLDTDKIMGNKFNSKRTFYKKKKKTSEAPTREQVTGAMEDYLKSGGSIEHINGPQIGDFKQRAFANFDGDFANILEEEERWDDL